MVARGAGNIAVVVVGGQLQIVGSAS